MIGTDTRGDPARDPVIGKGNTLTTGTANKEMATVQMGHLVPEKGNQVTDGSTICTKRSRTTTTEIDGQDWAGPVGIVVVTEGAEAAAV